MLQLVLYRVDSSDFHLTFVVRLMRPELRCHFVAFLVAIALCPPVTLSLIPLGFSFAVKHADEAGY